MMCEKSVHTRSAKARYLLFLRPTGELCFGRSSRNFSFHNTQKLLRALSGKLNDFSFCCLYDFSSQSVGNQITIKIIMNILKDDCAVLTEVNQYLHLGTWFMDVTVVILRIMRIPYL
jgi:hypothetical protein